MSTTTSNTVTIMLVEDDQIDAEAIQRAFKRARIANPIVVLSDGLAALECLRGTGETPPPPSPYLILLDLNMPRMNGIEFLEEIRADADLHGNVVLVLTTSDNDRDILAAYEQHVTGYMLKSNAGDDFMRLIGSLLVCRGNSARQRQMAMVRRPTMAC